MTSPGRLRTAAARATRTRSKHERWLRELGLAGWSVVRAAEFEIEADHRGEGVVNVYVFCKGCQTVVAHWVGQDVSRPLPQVLHIVSGHTCEVKS